MGYVITVAVFHRISSILQMIKWIEWSAYEKGYENGYCCLPKRAQLTTSKIRIDGMNQRNEMKTHNDDRQST